MTHPDSTLITGIGELVTNDGDRGVPSPRSPKPRWSSRTAGWRGPGPRRGAPAADAVVDAAGRAVLPGFADSHAHLVFAGERSAEFAARMAGRPYRAGGILATVEATRAAPDAVLRANLRRLAAEMLAQGTTTFECKSGYGLTVPDEARGVALAAEVTPEVTYLGAHVVPPEFAGRPGRLRRLGLRPDAGRLRAVRPAGSTCSARTGRSARKRPPRCSPRAGPRASAPGCTPASSDRAPASGSRPRPAPRRPTTARS